MRRRRWEHAEATYWPGFVDLLVALLAVVLLGSTVPSGTGGTGGNGAGVTPTLPSGPHRPKPEQTYQEQLLSYKLDRVKKSAQPLLEATVAAAKGVRCASDQCIIPFVEGKDQLQGFDGIIPPTFVSSVSQTVTEVMPSSAFSEQLAEKGLSVVQCNAYAYADKEMVTSMQLGGWLQALHRKLKELTKKPIEANVRADYRDNVNAPYVAIQLVFALNTTGQSMACKEYQDKGGSCGNR